jgi:hypothetical protein
VCGAVGRGGVIHGDLIAYRDFCAAICSVPSSCMLCEPIARLVLSASSAAASYGTLARTQRAPLKCRYLDAPRLAERGRDDHLPFKLPMPSEVSLGRTSALPSVAST